MENRELLEYIRLSLEQGDSVSNIKNALLENSWPFQEVEEALLKVLNEHITIHSAKLSARESELAGMLVPDFSADLPDEDIGAEGAGGEELPVGSSNEEGEKQSEKENLHSFPEVDNLPIQFPPTIGKIIADSGLPEKDEKEIKEAGASVALLSSAKQEASREENENVGKPVEKIGKDALLPAGGSSFAVKVKNTLFSPLGLGALSCVLWTVPFAGTISSVSGIYKSLSSKKSPGKIRTAGVSLCALGLLLSVFNGTGAFYSSAGATSKQAIKAGLLGVLDAGGREAQPVLSEAMARFALPGIQNGGAKTIVPDNWSEYQGENESEAVVLFRKDADADSAGGIYNATITILERQIGAGMTLLQYGREVKLSSRSAFENYEPVSEAIEFFGETPVYRLKGSLRETGLNLENEQYVFVFGDKAYIITGTYISDFAGENERAEEIKSIVERFGASPEEKQI